MSETIEKLKKLYSCYAAPQKACAGIACDACSFGLTTEEKEEALFNAIKELTEAKEAQTAADAEAGAKLPKKKKGSRRNGSEAGDFYTRAEEEAEATADKVKRVLQEVRAEVAALQAEAIININELEKASDALPEEKIKALQDFFTGGHFISVKVLEIIDEKSASY